MFRDVPGFIDGRAKGRNIVGQQLPTLLYACHVNRLKLWVTDPWGTTGDNGDLTRPMPKNQRFLR